MLVGKMALNIPSGKKSEVMMISSTFVPFLMVISIRVDFMGNQHRLCYMLQFVGIFSFWVPLMLHIVFPSSSSLVGDVWQ